MLDLPFVDSHVHFWDHAVPDVRWAWLRPGHRDGFEHPVLGAVDAIKAPRYGAAEFCAETRAIPVGKVVHVQAALDTRDPVAETRFVQADAAKAGLPAAIVAHADLTAPDLDETLDRHGLASPMLRGIRDFGRPGALSDAAYAHGYGRLGARGLVCELNCRWEEMPAARALADRHPDTVTVLGHAGYPAERTPEYFARWRDAITTLAGAENVHCKISGLGMGDHGWTEASIRPWVLHCLHAFGVDRCLFGTNWPVDRLFSDYGTVVDAYAAIVADLSRAERTALFSTNAERLFSF